MQVVSVAADDFKSILTTIISTTGCLDNLPWQHLAAMGAITGPVSMSQYINFPQELGSLPESLSWQGGLPYTLSSMLTDGTWPLIPMHSPITIMTFTTQASAYGSVIVDYLDQTADVHSMFSTLLRPGQHSSLPGCQLELLALPPMDALAAYSSVRLTALLPLAILTHLSPDFGNSVGSSGSSSSSSRESTALMVAYDWSCCNKHTSVLAEPATMHLNGQLQLSVSWQLSNMAVAHAMLHAQWQNTDIKSASTALVPYLSTHTSLATISLLLTYTEHRSMNGGGTTNGSAATAATATLALDALGNDAITDKVGFGWSCALRVLDCNCTAFVCSKVCCMQVPLHIELVKTAAVSVFVLHAPEALLAADETICCVITF